MELSRKQLDSILLAHHRIHPDKHETFKSRIKTLQRMGFPPGTNVGRGPKVSYSAEHLFMLVTVFELQQIGLAAERAIETVTRSWRQIRYGYGVAFELIDTFDKPTDEKIFGIVYGRSLADLQFQDPLIGPGEGRPMSVAITATALRVGLANHAPASKSFGKILLDFSDIMESVLRAAESVGGVSRHDEEIASWRNDKDATLPGMHLLRKANDDSNPQA